MSKKVKWLSLRAGLVFILILLASCGARQDGPPENYTRNWQDIDDATPVDVSPSRYGNPNTYEVFGESYNVIDSNTGFSQKGIASWYGNKFHGRRTSSGETYDMYAMTAAHKTLKIPVYVEVTNTRNGRKTIVKVNDRGPFHEGRIIDLSYAAATKLGVAATGTAPVTIRVVTPDTVVTDLPPGAEVDQKAASTINPAYTFDGGRVYVQVAAFSTEENAMKLLTKLRDKDFSSVRIHVESNQGSMLYRVRIGPLPTTHAAGKLLTQLKEINYNNVKIVTYN